MAGQGWDWPFEGGYKGYSEGQQFGFTSYDRTGRGDYFHDGFDFGSMTYQGQDIYAVHEGTVVYAGIAPGNLGQYLGAVVVTKSTDGYYVVYQEFGTSEAQILVIVGAQLKVGDLVAHRDTDHLHLGITKKDWLEAQSSAYSNDGTWLNPVEVIENGEEIKAQGGNQMFCLYTFSTGVYYCNGDGIFALVDPAQINILQAIYNANTGKDMPTFDWTGTNPTAGLLEDIFRHKITKASDLAELGE
ncbi:M23 family metallopeptidase [Enterococcus malodoratus]|uniref:M23 family metallopeptidase n=1 Tax=Enterococcus malodoratus TaxID=71451 RepID=UPI0039B07EBD